MNVHPIHAPERENIFGIPTFKGVVPIDDLRSDLFALIHSGAIDGDNKRSSVGDTWRSNLMLHRLGHERAFPVLDELITRVKLFCTGAVGRAFNIEECWLNLLRRNAYNSVHDHYPHEWSGVVWIDAEHEPENTYPAGCLEFVSPFPHRVHPGDGNLQVQPINGASILFPSSLKHMVHPTRTDAARISFAWNGHFVGGRVT